mmetsp:Transcript_160/g.236  ORF Transcript_160/g.236 Transcript_160/m.236 type:complete len:219 (-) Transcript_160:87-743(-)
MSQSDSKRRQLLIRGYLRNFETQFKLSFIPDGIQHIIYLFQKNCDVWDDSIFAALEKPQHIQIDAKEKDVIRVLDDARCTIYGSHIVNTGVYKWTLKILNINYNNINYPPFVGVIKNTPNDVLAQHYSDTSWYTSHKGYMLCGGVQKLYCSAFNEKTYGKAFDRSNHVIEMILNLNKKTISYTINGTDCGVAFKDIELVDYRFALGVCGNRGSSFQFL